MSTNRFTVLDSSDDEVEVKKIPQIKTEIYNSKNDEMLSKFKKSKKYNNTHFPNNSTSNSTLPHSTNNSNSLNLSNSTNNINYNNSNYNNSSYGREKDNCEDFKEVSTKKKIKPVGECTIITCPSDIEQQTMTNYFRIIAHHNEDKSWDWQSFHKITVLTRWFELATFINTLNNTSGLCKYSDFDIFAMKNEITPMWEDNENRNGSILSVKIESHSESYAIFKKILFHAANNTLLKFNVRMWDCVNGISINPKKNDNMNKMSSYVILKLWLKINVANYSPEKILNSDIYDSIRTFSIKIKPIKPEF